MRLGARSEGAVLTIRCLRIAHGEAQPRHHFRIHYGAAPVLPEFSSKLLQSPRALRPGDVLLLPLAVGSGIFLSIDDLGRAKIQRGHYISQLVRACCKQVRPDWRRKALKKAKDEMRDEQRKKQNTTLKYFAKRPASFDTNMPS